MGKVAMEYFSKRKEAAEKEAFCNAFAGIDAAPGQDPSQIFRETALSICGIQCALTETTELLTYVANCLEDEDAGYMPTNIVGPIIKSAVAMIKQQIPQLNIICHKSVNRIPEQY